MNVYCKECKFLSKRRVQRDIHKLLKKSGSGIYAINNAYYYEAICAIPNTIKNSEINPITGNHSKAISYTICYPEKKNKEFNCKDFIQKPFSSFFKKLFEFLSTPSFDRNE